jgi:predicted ferric reductase
VLAVNVSWYAARSAGLVGWALLTASVLWGLVLSTKAAVLGRRPRPAWTLDLHRYLGGLATIFTAVHVVAVVADSYLHFGVAAVLIPFASSWRPAAVAWGVVAMYLLAAVELTALARKHLSRRVWRATHMASFPLYLFATVHAVSAGTDGRSMLFVTAAAVSIAGVCGLVALRLAPPEKPVSTAARFRERVAA